jgi:hypothetical protein
MNAFASRSPSSLEGLDRTGRLRVAVGGSAHFVKSNPPKTREVDAEGLLPQEQNRATGTDLMAFPPGALGQSGGR